MNIEFVGNFMDNAVGLAYDFIMVIFSDFIYNKTEEVMDLNFQITKDNQKMIQQQFGKISPELIKESNDKEIMLSGWHNNKRGFVCLKDNKLVLDTSFDIDPDSFEEIKWVEKDKDGNEILGNKLDPEQKITKTKDG